MLTLFAQAAFGAALILLPFHARAVAQDTPQDSEALPPLTEEVSVESSPYLKALALVEGHLASLDSFQADFTQSNPGGKVAVGTLYLQQPGRIRFDYSDDTPFLVVADGEVLSFVDYEVGQVTRWPVADTPLRLFLDDRPDLAAMGAQIQINPAGLEDHIAVRASDPDNPGQGVITIFFEKTATSATGLTLKSWVVEDAQGRITVVEVSNGRANPSLASSLWAYDDPRGLAKRRRTR